MSNDTLQALILAAGFGTRLFPLTRYIPKPLLPILDVPALERICRRLQEAGFRRLVINTHHLAQLIEVWAAASDLEAGPAISHEPEILGTGGAVALARQFLKEDSPIVIWNGDIAASVDPSLLIEKYNEMGSPDALLVIHDRPPFNKLRIDPSGMVRSFSHQGPDARAFTGISVMGPGLAASIPIEPCSLVDVWSEAMEQGGTIAAVELKTVSFRPCYWEDIGTLEGYFRASEAVHRSIGMKSGTFVSPRAKVAQGVQFRGFVAVNGQARIEDLAVLEDVILLPGTVVPEGQKLYRCVAAPWGRFEF